VVYCLKGVFGNEWKGAFTEKQALNYCFSPEISTKGYGWNRQFVGNDFNLKALFTFNKSKTPTLEIN